jgi:hypothetical protein
MVHRIVVCLLSRRVSVLLAALTQADGETQPFLQAKDDPRTPAVPVSASYGSMPLPIRPVPSRSCEV